MCVEASERVSLIPVVCGADVCIICDDEVILSDLILYLRDNWAWVGLWNLGQMSSLQELVVILLFKHGLELGSHGNAHLVDFTLYCKLINENLIYIKVENVAGNW